MRKNFWPWHKLKSSLHHRINGVPFFHEREVWFCSLGLNVGHEQDGKNTKYERPVIVLKKFNEKTFWGIPATSKFKSGKYFFRLINKGNIYFAILSQIRLFDARRLNRKIRQLPMNEFEQLKTELKKLI